MAGYKVGNGARFSNKALGEAEALRLGVEEHLEQFLLEPAEDVLERARKNGETTTKVAVDEDARPEDGETLVVWHKDGGTNFGFGLGESLNKCWKEENVWIEV